MTEFLWPYVGKPRGPTCHPAYLPVDGYSMCVCEGGGGVYMCLITRHTERRILLQTVTQINSSMSTVCVCPHLETAPCLTP